MDMGTLVPIMCEPVVPGDTFKVNTEVLMRFAPLASPVMHRMNVYTHFFFVPYRLVWDKWKDFITGGEHRSSKVNPNPQPEYPTVTLNDTALVDVGVSSQDPTILGPSDKPYLFGNGTLFDYLGFPATKSIKHNGVSPLKGMKVDLLPFRAYQLIWNEYYRDQNLQDPVDIYTEESGNRPYSSRFDSIFSLHKRAWEKDYFTSALPWPQAGEDVRLPLYGDLPVTVDGSFNIPEEYGFSHSLDGSYPSPGTDSSAPSGNASFQVGHDGKTYLVGENNKLVASKDGIDIKLQGYGDLSHVSAATINELRRAVRAQEFLEKSARGGSRYIEQLLTFFGVKSSDARLQRPEYLGGGKSPVVVSDVQQTSQTTQGDDGSPQGNLTGQAASLQRSHSFKRFFEEHGLIIGIMSVLPRTAYMQGLPRKYTKFDREDHYWPQFASLGEQEIKNSEIYFDGNDSNNDSTFGYTPRYAEYKYIPSRVCGDFRDTLSYWHMARIFKNRPNLNGDFVTYKGDDRIFAYTGEDFQKLWVNIYNRITAVRPMPRYGTPML